MSNCRKTLFKYEINRNFEVFWAGIKYNYLWSLTFAFLWITSFIDHWSRHDLKGWKIQEIKSLQNEKRNLTRAALFLFVWSQRHLSQFPEYFKMYSRNLQSPHCQSLAERAIFPFVFTTLLRICFAQLWVNKIKSKSKLDKNKKKFLRQNVNGASAADNKENNVELEDHLDCTKTCQPREDKNQSTTKVIMLVPIPTACTRHLWIATNPSA